MSRLSSHIPPVVLLLPASLPPYLPGNVRAHERGLHPGVAEAPQHRVGVWSRAAGGCAAESTQQGNEVGGCWREDCPVFVEVVTLCWLCGFTKGGTAIEETSTQGTHAYMLTYTGAHPDV